jgi:hypothetical protein
MVFDLVIDRMQFVTVSAGTVNFGTGTTMPVDSVCKDTMLWFLIPVVQEDDKTLVRAIVAETEHARTQVH